MNFEGLEQHTLVVFSMLTVAGISFGPLLVGFALNTILYGALVTSMLLYFSSFKSDGAWIRLLVSTLLFLCTADVILEYVFLNDTLIIHFGDQYALSRANWVFSLLPGITVFFFGCKPLVG